MAGDFAYRTLGQVAAIQTGPFGSQLHAQDYKKVGVPVVMPTNIVDRRIDSSAIAKVSQTDADRLSRHKLQIGDVVFSRRGEIDKCALVTEENEGWLCGTGCLLARVDKARSLPRYLAFHISSPETREWLQAHAVGLVMPNLNTGILERLPLRLPPIHQQETIADLLGSLDDKIELNRRMAETLEAMGRALFKNWFVDFGPVHAKAEGRATGLSNDLAALFPGSFGDDGLPDGWSRTPLLDHARLISGGTPKTSEPTYWDGDLLWASAKDVSQCPDRFLITTERTITQSGLEESATRLVSKFATVVVARGATTGRHCLFGREMAMNQTCYALQSVGGAPFWLACTFTYLVDELVRGAHGSVFNTITTTTLNTARVTTASPEVVLAFEDTVRPIYLRMLSVIEQNSSIKALRDTLLPKLISGELRITDAEAQVSAA
ncbi:MAG: restriction endonuclease subunit S [Variibacter sp.]